MLISAQKKKLKKYKPLLWLDFYGAGLEGLNFYEYLINIYAHYACSIAEAAYTITIKH